MAFLVLQAFREHEREKTKKAQEPSPAELTDPVKTQNETATTQAWQSFPIALVRLMFALLVIAFGASMLVQGVWWGLFGVIAGVVAGAMFAARLVRCVLLIRKLKILKTLERTEPK